MNEALFSRRDEARRGGFTLVEVVIALAIFVFGAVAIIRIFPPALGVIQNSGDKLTALDLNRTTLAKLSKEGGTVPYAVHDVYTKSEIDNSRATAVVGTAIRNNSLPSRNVQSVDQLNTSASALGRFKFISGEKQKVRKVVIKKNGITPTEVFYVLTNFPIRGEAQGNPAKLYPLAQIYTEMPVSGVMAETKALSVGGPRKSGFLNFTNSEPSTATLQGLADFNNFYYVSYAFLENGKLNMTTDEAIRSKTQDTSTTFLISDTTNDKARLLQGRRFDDSPASGALSSSRVIEGPVQVRFRQRLADLSQPPTNPAAATVTDDAIIQNTLNNLGILVVTNVPNIAVGQDVTVDYQINNWQQIVHSGTPSIVPEATPLPGPPAPPTARRARELVLPLRALVDASDGTNDSTLASETYSLLSYIDPGISTSVPTIQANALNISDNQATITRQGPFNPQDPASDLSTNNPYFLWSVNRKGGRVLFDLSDHAMAPFTPADYEVIGTRVVYKTIDNWTHQLSVAPTTYTPFYNEDRGPFNNNNVNTNPAFAGISGNVNVAEPWRYYSWGANSSQPGRIFFPPSEAGKTISLSYTYLDAGVEKEVNNEVVTINSNWIKDTEAPSDYTAGQVTSRPRQLAVADAAGDRWLAYAEPKIVGSGALPITSIRSIRGLSIQARTAWLDGSNFAQVSTTGFRGDSN